MIAAKHPSIWNILNNSIDIKFPINKCLDIFEKVFAFLNIDCIYSYTAPTILEIFF